MANGRFGPEEWTARVELAAAYRIFDMTIADRNIQQEIEKHQREGVPVRVSRFLGVDLPAGRPQHLRSK